MHTHCFALLSSDLSRQLGRIWMLQRRGGNLVVAGMEPKTPGCQWNAWKLMPSWSKKSLSTVFDLASSLVNGKGQLISVGLGMDTSSGPSNQLTWTFPEISNIVHWHSEPYGVKSVLHFNLAELQHCWHLLLLNLGIRAWNRGGWLMVLKCKEIYKTKKAWLEKCALVCD